MQLKIPIPNGPQHGKPTEHYPSYRRSYTPGAQPADVWRERDEAAASAEAQYTIQRVSSWQLAI
jgi:hypothetical protein